jgi:hypothetical protein
MVTKLGGGTPAGDIHTEYKRFNFERPAGVVRKLARQHKSRAH